MTATYLSYNVIGQYQDHKVLQLTMNAKTNEPGIFKTETNPPQNPRDYEGWAVPTSTRSLVCTYTRNPFFMKRVSDIFCCTR